MSISSLLLKYQTKFEKVNEEIESFPYTITSSDIKNDLNYLGDKTIGDKTGQEGNGQGLNLSLFQLNAKIKEHEDNLSSLNKLWLIRGLVSEIEHALNGGDEGGSVGSAELESVFFNLEKLEVKLVEFREANPSALIADKLFECHDKLYDDALEQIRVLFDNFFPPDGNIFVNPIIVNGIEFEYNGEFLPVFYKYTERNNSELIIGKKLHEKQIHWDKAVLDEFLIKRNGYVVLEKEESETATGDISIKYQLVNVEKSNTTQLSTKYFSSLTAFIRFINLFENHALQNFYLSKISRNVTNIISQNIDKLMSDRGLLEELIEVLELSKRTNWSLSVSSSLTLGNIVDNLNELYLDWMVDGYVDKIREVFNNEKELGEMIKRQRIEGNTAVNGSSALGVSSAPSKPSAPFISPPSAPITEEKDAWDDNWDEGWDEPEDKDEENTEEPKVAEDDDDDEWDAWDEEIQLEESPKKPKSSGVAKQSTVKPDAHVVADGYVVTEIPTHLIEILSSFLAEERVQSSTSTSTKYNLLITCILSFASITYPTLERSFILYNDLLYLYYNAPMDSPEILTFTNTLWRKLQLDLLPFIEATIKKINLAHDDYIPSSESDFQLDSTTSTQIENLQNWFTKFLDSESLLKENPSKYKELLTFFIDYINNWLTNSIIKMTEITEYQSNKLNTIIQEVVINTTLPIATKEIDANAENSIGSFHRLENIQFLISNHLADIMDRFYNGEFYDLESSEIIDIIKSIFVKSELREGYIQEILDIRNIDNE